MCVTQHLHSKVKLHKQYYTVGICNLIIWKGVYTGPVLLFPMIWRHYVTKGVSSQWIWDSAQILEGDGLFFFCSAM